MNRRNFMQMLAVSPLVGLVKAEPVGLSHLEGKHVAVTDFGLSIQHDQVVQINRIVDIESDGKVIYVDENATGKNDGTSWDDAYTSLADFNDRID